MSKIHLGEDTDVITKDTISVIRPPMYKVILLNDNYTSMEFVVLVLETIFHKPSAEAYKIMLSVHQAGSGIAGIYTKEVAETKVNLVHEFAKQNEFPLRCKIEPE